MENLEKLNNLKNKYYKSRADYRSSSLRYLISIKNFHLSKVPLEELKKLEITEVVKIAMARYLFCKIKNEGFVNTGDIFLYNDDKFTKDNYLLYKILEVYDEGFEIQIGEKNFFVGEREYSPGRSICLNGFDPSILEMIDASSIEEVKPHTL